MVSSKVKTTLFDKEALEINTYTNGQKTEKKQMDGKKSWQRKVSLLMSKDSQEQTRLLWGAGRGGRRAETKATSPFL